MGPPPEFERSTRNKQTRSVYLVLRQLVYLCALYVSSPASFMESPPTQFMESLPTPYKYRLRDDNLTKAWTPGQWFASSTTPQWTPTLHAKCAPRPRRPHPLPSPPSSRPTSTPPSREARSICPRDARKRTKVSTDSDGGLPELPGGGDLPPAALRDKPEHRALRHRFIIIIIMPILLTGSWAKVAVCRA